MSEPRIRQTLCWDCANATGGCSWADHDTHTPVKDWTAIETKIRIHNPSIPDQHTRSYIVITCPEFIRDAEGHGTKRLNRADQRQRRTGTKQQQAIAQAYQCGISIREISEDTDLPEQVIHQILERNGAKNKKEGIK